MEARALNKRVRSFRRDYLSEGVSLEGLTRALEKQGFTLVEFNPVINDEDVTTVIHALGLEEMVARSPGFLYQDRDFRLVFLNEKLSEEEKLLVLAHEEGHLCCSHLERSGIVGQEVLEEFEAHAFAAALLRKSFGQRLGEGLRKHRMWVLAILLVAALSLAGAFGYREVRQRQLYEGEFYVTEKGTKYHRKGCVTIQGHEVRRLSREDVSSGRYEPCGVCHPDE